MFNSLKTDIPDWVKAYPDEPDWQTLQTLARFSKAVFSKPREMNYVLLGSIKEGGKWRRLYLLSKKKAEK